ncbi:hypothetical protein [Xanthomonas sp. CFBP 8151]|uniref:hypothetical protein n=1 Tax=Xanthomonas sp. CFBP 8151 TaxID=3035310 RepID=UPI001FB93B5D|nr:hypothetical protein [Xanthomonas sp. CFBP 8151]
MPGVLVNPFVTFDCRYPLIAKTPAQRSGHGGRRLHPGEVIAARAQLRIVQGDEFDACLRHFLQQGLQGAGRAEAIACEGHCTDRHLELAQRLLEIPRGAGRTITIAATDLRPIGDQAARLGAAETERSSMQHALRACQPWQQPEDQWQAVAHRYRKIAPVRRAAGDQPQLRNPCGLQRGMAASQLAAQAVTAQHARQPRVMQVEQRPAGGDIVGKQRAIAPVVLARGAQRAAAMAAPLVQIHRDAGASQGVRERLVVSRSNAQCRQPQQAGDRPRRCVAQHLPGVSIRGGDGKRAGLHAHGLGAAPKWSSTSTSP